MSLSKNLPSALSHIRWIGGGSGGAKSTIARGLRDARGAIVYDTDAAMRDHASRCPADQCPHLAAFMRMTMDERWLSRTPQQMLDSFHWFQGEGFELIIEDLLALPRDTPVIAEGFRLLPHLIRPLIQTPQDAIWLLPSPTFRRLAFDARGTTWDIPNRTRDPELALTNLLARDALFTQRLDREVTALGLRKIRTDGALSEKTLLSTVDDWLFGQRAP